jgi:chromosome partitioning protein
MRTIVVANQKGGVGRTTVTMQLAAGLSHSLRVLVVDMDPQQSTRWWAQDARGSLPFTFAGAQSAGALLRLDRVGVGFDVALVDTPAGPNDRGVDAALNAADFVIVPLIPEPLAVEPTMRTIHQAIEPRHLPFSVLLNKIDPRRPEQLAVWERRLDTDWGYPRFEHPLTTRRSHLEAPLFGECATSPRTRAGHAAASADIAMLSDAVHEQLVAPASRFL